MQNVLTVNELRWEAQQIQNQARIRTERRAWMRNFALVFALILLTLAVTKVLLNMRGLPGLSL